MVTDVCPECLADRFDLPTETWDAVVGGAPGLEPITFREVECVQPEQIQLHMRDGVNPYWISFPLAGQLEPLLGVEVASGPAAGTAATFESAAWVITGVGAINLPVDIRLISGAEEQLVFTLTSLDAGWSSTGVQFNSRCQ